eukprot:TRINITY_DN5554_c0_g1_i1.p1 TRINITY_DN5554_c0_g1~~TRINITY_DN5554_c0_g1_i1.p1  ORF type:complete len:364 (-),score=84.40 TRINITY_DN5554_c0_g1_i1:52-1143(-)
MFASQEAEEELRRSQVNQASSSSSAAASGGASKGANPFESYQDVLQRLNQQKKLQQQQQKDSTPSPRRASSRLASLESSSTPNKRSSPRIASASKVVLSTPPISSPKTVVAKGKEKIIDEPELDDLDQIEPLNNDAASFIQPQSQDDEDDDVSGEESSIYARVDRSVDGKSRRHSTSQQVDDANRQLDELSNAGLRLGVDDLIPDIGPDEPEYRTRNLTEEISMRLPMAPPGGGTSRFNFDDDFGMSPMRSGSNRDAQDEGDDGDEFGADANLLSVSIRPGDLIPDSAGEDAPQLLEFDLPSPPRVEDVDEIQEEAQPEPPLPSPPKTFRAASRKSASPQKRQQRSPEKDDSDGLSHMEKLQG